ncbi:MAG: tartrate-resistant acid phosphatase type 5 family protein [Hyphomicrobiales bacterium]|nr:tartrate-resistant acid phosphatase type 5 family protein [Hyphomicrobiales bacterium]
MTASHVAAITRRKLLAGSLAAAISPLPAFSAGAEEPGLNFLAVGDWGSPGVAPVARAMGEWAAEMAPAAIISTGDNFYPAGIHGGADPRWQSSYEQFFVAPGLQCPWHVVLGNHDHLGDIEAQIAYTAKSPRWRMPARYFSWSQLLPDGAVADFFFIDTTPVHDGTHGLLSTFVPLEAFVVSQFRWLETELAASKADWKIVVGHHPVFSGGVHGPTWGLVRYLKPMLEEHGVRVYLNGHDHDFQHIAIDGVNYITCGGGAEPRKVAAASGTLFARSTFGFLAASLTKASFSFSFVDVDGRPFYAVSVANAA